MKRTLLAGLVLAMGLLSSPAAAYEEIVVTDGGELTGTVKFVGAPPRLEPLRVAKNRDVCGETKEAQALVVDSAGGVAGSVVMIEGVSRGNKADGELIVDNHNCLFVPRVSAAMTGARAGRAQLGGIESPCGTSRSDRAASTAPASPSTTRRRS